MEGKATKSFYCPVEIALSVIGGKWKPIIMWILRDGRRRFGDIKAELPSVAHKVLSQQLKQLERDGMVRRVVNASTKREVAYEITEFGRTICPMLNALGQWGMTNFQRLGVEYRPFDASLQLGK